MPAPRSTATQPTVIKGIVPTTGAVVGMTRVQVATSSAVRLHVPTPPGPQRPNRISSRATADVGRAPSPSRHGFGRGRADVRPSCSPERIRLAGAPKGEGGVVGRSPSALVDQHQPVLAGHLRITRVNCGWHFWLGARRSSLRIDATSAGRCPAAGLWTRPSDDPQHGQTSRVCTPNRPRSGGRSGSTRGWRWAYTWEAPASLRDGSNGGVRGNGRSEERP